MRAAAVLLALAVIGGRSAAAQIQIRIGDSTRTIYSEIHESLREGTPAADTVAAIMGEKKTAKLWPRIRDAFAGRRPYNDALLALTRIAELRNPTARTVCAAGAIESGREASKCRRVRTPEISCRRCMPSNSS